MRCVLLIAPFLFANCATRSNQKMVVSVADQRMLLVQGGEPVAVYPVSTSKFGVGDKRGSYRTPLGKMEVASKIGGGLPNGAVLKSRRFTGEVLRVNAPGRDPIVTRIIWLRGQERRNKNAYSRFIYIHGTPEERNIGRPASYGCIRMRSRDVKDLFDRVEHGAEVVVTLNGLPRTAKKVQPPDRQPGSPRPQDGATTRTSTQMAGVQPPPPAAPPRQKKAPPQTQRPVETASNANLPQPPGGKRGWWLSREGARRLLGHENQRQPVDSL